MKHPNLLVLALAGIIVVIFAGCSSDKSSSPCLTCPGPDPTIALARQYLVDYQEHWPLRDGSDEWCLADVDHGGGGFTYLAFYQYYRGQRVRDGYAWIRVSDDLRSVEGRVYFVEGVSAGITINISAADAQRIASQHLNWDGAFYEGWSSGEPLIIEHEGRFHLCWQVGLRPAGSRYSWTYLIGTSGGDVVDFYHDEYVARQELP